MLAGSLPARGTRKIPTHHPKKEVAIMAAHTTHKSSAQGKALTLARRSIRQTKRTDYTGYVPVLGGSDLYPIAITISGR